MSGWRESARSRGYDRRATRNDPQTLVRDPNQLAKRGRGPEARAFVQYFARFTCAMSL
jgi:hypothetical protein